MRIYARRRSLPLWAGLFALLCAAEAAAQAQEPAAQCETELPCCGAFRHPLPELISGPELERREIDAVKVRQDAEGVTHLEGKARIRYGRRQLEAGGARMDPDGNEAQLFGGVRLVEPGFLVEGEEARLRTDSGDGVLTALRYTLFEPASQGRAESLQREGDVLQLREASWSACPPQREWWSIRADTIRIDRKSQYVTARNLRLLAGRVPVLYLPWFGFPAGEVRHSGLLQPVVSYSRSDGIDWKQPLYLNLAPNYDAVIAPRYIDERGAMLEGEFRWLLPHLQGELRAAHLEEDRSAADARRWLYRADLKTRGSERWNGFVRYAKSSDANYLYDLETLRPHYLEQRGALQYADRNWLLRLQSVDYQALRGSEENAFNRQQPEALLRWRSRGGPFKPEYLLQAEYSDFQASTDSRSSGSRVRAQAGVAWPMQKRGASLRPWLKVRHLAHSPEHARTRRVTALSAGLSASALLERSVGAAGRALRQTLEPRLFYLYTRERASRQAGLPIFESGAREFTPEQLFRESRFSGRDRIADDNRLSLALRTRLIDEESGRELLSLQLGQIFYFEDREVLLDEAPQRDPSLSNSPLAVEWSARPAPRWLWRGEAVVDSRKGRFDAGLWELRYEASRDGAHLSLLHRYDRFREAGEEALEQARMRLDIPRGNWRFFANWDYDIERKRDVLAEGGFRFSGCCWTAGLRWNRTLEDDDLWDNSVSFEFALYGIGARRADD